MSVWFCIPSKRPPEEAEKCLKMWRERGYKVALYVDEPRPKDPERVQAMYWPTDGKGYAGYPYAVNFLVRQIISYMPNAEWFVTGGDDVEPDANHSAEEIAAQCNQYFVRHNLDFNKTEEQQPLEKCKTFGVMQPTGDKWGDRNGPYIERVAGSPWMGREFCRRMYQGRGPLCEEYFHMGEDEELQAVATMLGVFWQRPDLIQLHNHWGRIAGRREDMPSFLERANSPEEWRKYKEIFRIRQQLNFPGHEPLEA